MSVGLVAVILVWGLAAFFVVLAVIGLLLVRAELRAGVPTSDSERGLDE